MKDLITRINSLIHQEINPYSPANNTFYGLYKTDQEKYKEAILKQVEEYRTKNLKYFQMACIHIDTIGWMNDGCKYNIEIE